MRRVVLDTNVLVSALLAPHGNEALVLRLALSGAFEIGVTTAILNEYREVLERPRFKISSAAIDALFSQFKTQAKLVHPAHIVEASPDESDNRFLECAETIRRRVPHYRKQTAFSKNLENHKDRQRPRVP